MTAVVVVVLVALGAGCGVGWWRTARRVGALEARVARAIGPFLTAAA